MDDLVASAGADPTGFAAQQLSERVLRTADLMLAMSREHRSVAVGIWPAAVRRAFTLREYARLLQTVEPADLPSGSPADRARASIHLAAARRRHSTEADDNLPDPFRRGEAAYRTAFDQIRRAVDEIGAILRSPAS
jgi:protein-tyrosine phosphatase